MSRAVALGGRRLDPPVVLAPMAGVTNAPFRSLCRRFGPGLVYVNEMVMATGLVRGSTRSRSMVSFSPDEDFRSLQLYGSDPATIGEAVGRLCAADAVDHVDLNFGCPAAKVTRRGGGAAVPLKRNLLRAIVSAAVTAADPYGVPVTCKFRMGIDDHLLTFVETGLICEEVGASAITLHARTAEQHYAPSARWSAIAELKREVRTIPVFGNGDVWTAEDAIRMMAETGCDGVVIGRGCLGRPWLFRDLVAAFAGRLIPDAPTAGEMFAVMLDHADALCTHAGADRGIRDFRKHASWYLTGYPVGGEARRAFAQVASLEELIGLVSRVDPDLRLVPGGERIVRGHSNGPIRVALPPDYLKDRDDLTVPDDADVVALSGG